MNIYQHTREDALDRYYSNPNRCLECGSIIHVQEGHKVGEARVKKFCNRSCAAIYNNKKFPKRTVQEKPVKPPRVRKVKPPRIKRTRWTNSIDEATFCAIAISSTSIKEMLEKFGQSSSRMNYTWIKEKLVEYKINTAPWYTSEGKYNKKLDLKDIMVKDSTYPGTKLKNRLIKEDILKNECSLCGQITEWKEQDLVMILDHINGINTDHRLKNLRLVCPNCDSQLPTYKSRNKTMKNRVQGAEWIIKK